MSENETPYYRSALRDALGKPIPIDGDLRLWLDDDLVDRRAPVGWAHLRTAREACLALLTGRVVELSLDSDLNGDQEFGRGYEVIDFLEEMAGEHGRNLWPRKITIHSANSASKGRMIESIESLPGRLGIKVEGSLSSGGKPCFSFPESRTDSSA